MASSCSSVNSKKKHTANAVVTDKNTLVLHEATCGDLVFDWSYQFLTREAVTEFAAARLPADFAERKAELLNGRYMNISEGREVSHVLSRSRNSVLRDTGSAGGALGGADNSKFARTVLKLRSGNWLGATGKPITDVVNIGVGGSDLGPLMTSFALREFASDIQQHELHTHFVSSMDGGQLYAVLPICDPETTLFIIASKSFGTSDTFANVETVKCWVQEHFSALSPEVASEWQKAWLEHHIIGVSANVQKMTDYGIPPAHQLVFEESVGGRFSMWSSIGLAIATTCGVQVFQRLLAGAAEMDAHFDTAPVTENIPMLMALLGVYNREERGINNIAILPYDGRFRHLPSYLQQLDMESNGKQYTATGEAICAPTAPIVWGGFGPNGQHAFFQHLHQGYDQFTADFVCVLHRAAPKFSASVAFALDQQQKLSVANCLAHRRLMAFGEQSETPTEHYPGKHPTSLFALKELTPESFGAMIAAYEHKIFVQGLIWSLNSFDQPGVEQGKKVAITALKRMHGESDEQFDASTDAIIRMI
ncbi:glucose-6-phosphate isomerase [Idiomarina sp. A28L]|uniref:glucose-6-phosphate isomerase n=1 Tax=Idiomarina sp. A28L TaxID=1036674 RepID=UPI0002138CC2|nr:glucose-6-phosphate isomerase [Idiomarina sp. A28L]EGN74618.1 glucose-6-phosphate isomerase [Idiomarina sp. A28L]